MRGGNNESEKMFEVAIKRRRPIRHLARREVPRYRISSPTMFALGTSFTNGCTTLVFRLHLPSQS